MPRCLHTQHPQKSGKTIFFPGQTLKRVRAVFHCLAKGRNMWTPTFQGPGSSGRSRPPAAHPRSFQASPAFAQSFPDFLRPGMRCFVPQAEVSFLVLVEKSTWPCGDSWLTWWSFFIYPVVHSTNSPQAQDEPRQQKPQARQTQGHPSICPKTSMVTGHRPGSLLPALPPRGGGRRVGFC